MEHPAPPEGVFWTYPDLGQFVEDDERFAQLMKHAELIEREPSVMGASAHLLAVAAKGADGEVNTEV